MKHIFGIYVLITLTQKGFKD
jgi:hypothetical protein